MSDTPSTISPSPVPSRSRRKLWIILGILVLLGLLAFALRSWWFPEPGLQPGAERPLDLPIDAPDVTSLDDIARLTEGKPVPPPFPGLFLPPISTDDHILGEQDAALSIVEYSNFGNKYAILLHPELRALVQASDGDVNWVVRDYPMTKNDTLAAQAAECAYLQGGHEAFWNYFTRTFGTPTVTAASAQQAASSLSLDPTELESCMSSGQTNNFVLKDAQDGRLDAKITVSPSYVITNNVSGDIRLVEGVNTVEYIQRVIDAVR